MPFSRSRSIESMTRSADLLGLVRAERPGLPEHGVDEGGLAVVDVGDDGEVAQVVARGHGRRARSCGGCPPRLPARRALPASSRAATASAGSRSPGSQSTDRRSAGATQRSASCCSQRQRLGPVGEGRQPDVHDVRTEGPVAAHPGRRGRPRRRAPRGSPGPAPRARSRRPRPSRRAAPSPRPGARARSGGRRATGRRGRSPPRPPRQPIPCRTPCHAGPAGNSTGGGSGIAPCRGRGCGSARPAAGRRRPA